ncbi:MULTISPECIES: hypothetical protein [unclassified Streptomyces]|uniref:hypothetical protein n=1 Tax=unclassified Streptomyces TaxID=2593676 RepID=UPI00380D8993
MRGDETQLDSTGGGDPRGRGGPRHAAPRKSLLTKWHMPAGKAMALAAMPTAVLVGMTLTPKLAMADDKTDIPFAPGPCVTRSDSPPASPSPSSSASGKASPSPSAASPDSRAAKSKEPTPSASGSAAGSVDKLLKPVQPSDTPSSDTASSDTAAAPAPAQSAAPPAKTTNPLDPLGLGDALKGLFGIHDTPSATPSDTPPPSAPPPAAPKPAQSASKPASTASKPTTNTGKAADQPLDKTAEAIKKAADQAGQKVSELPAAAKGLDPKKDTAIPNGAKQPFPCPTADPKALAAAKQDSGVPTLPSQPWILKSSMLTLSGLNYAGIVEVKTGDTTKKVLKFTASSVDIKDLHQLVYGPEVGGTPTTTHVQARSGSTSTIRNGTVTMYTEELKGNLFGLIPISFSPATPPPLNVPFAFFTNVTVRQAGQFGGTLTVPGLHNFVTNGNPE